MRKLQLNMEFSILERYESILQFVIEQGGYFK
jgi:hypothetical protein